MTNNVGGRRVAVPCARARRVCRTPGRRSTLHAVRTRALSEASQAACVRECLRRPPYGSRISAHARAPWSGEIRTSRDSPARCLECGGFVPLRSTTEDPQGWSEKKASDWSRDIPSVLRLRALARAASRTYVTTVNVTCLDLSNPIIGNAARRLRERLPVRERRQQQTKRKRIAHASPEPQIARGLQPPARLQPGSRCTMSMHAAERPRRVDRTGRTPIIHHLAGRCVMALLALRHLHPVGHGWLVVASARGGRAPKEELRSKRNTITPVKLCRGVYTTSTTSVANARHTHHH